MGHTPIVLSQELRTPPAYCQCAGGACDQSFDFITATRGTFLYPSSPPLIADTIEGAVTLLKRRDTKAAWRTWKEITRGGQTIFCEICRRARFSEHIFADVTTLNFNLLFEIGFALGLGLPVVPIRDASYILHKKEFEELGLIDTLKYIDFSNADQLANAIQKDLPFPVNPMPVAPLSSQQPLYIVKGPLDTEGEVRLLSLLRKTRLRFRMLDVSETPRVSLHEVRREVAMSIGVVAHLLDPNRQGAPVHNARCALIAGLATATGKIVLLLQEGAATQPIDYRDVVIPYSHASQLEQKLEPFVRSVVDRLQDTAAEVAPASERLLERLNLGAVAAENEVIALRSYFVRSGQFHDAKRGTGRLVTGRKGAGKTALFFAVRDSIPTSGAHLVLDLKPEGYQFTKLREAVLDELTHGLQEHTLMAFWEYILLCEMAQKVVDNEMVWASQDESRRALFERVREVYLRQPSADVGDFSERLLFQVDALVDRFKEKGLDELELSGRLTEVLFRGEIRHLHDALVPYLLEKDDVWVLVDNLDKAWPTKGAAPADILIIRTLLDATRKLQRQFEQRDLELRVLVFLRNDIYDLLLRQTPDRGKDTQIALDWDDPELFRQIVLQRIVSSTKLSGTFDEVWTRLFVGHVGLQDSFQYLLDRTLMRPRDLLSLLRRVVETAINRGHEKVTEDDIRTAEKSYSEDMLLAITFELRDIRGQYGDLLYVFLDCAPVISPEIVREKLTTELPQDSVDPVIEVLSWFGFFGVLEAGHDEATFAYQVRYNVEKLLAPIRRGSASFVIHPAFRRALDVV